MQDYFYEGLLPDDVIPNLMFRRMLDIRKGTLKEACEKAAREVITENKDLVYSYAYWLEAYVDEYLREGKNLTLWNALKYSMFDYLVNVCLHDNIYTYLENYVEALLYEHGFTATQIASLHSYLLRFVDYELYDTRLDFVPCEVERFAVTHRLP